MFFKFLTILCITTQTSAEYGPSILSLIQPLSVPNDELPFISDKKIVREGRDPNILQLEDFPSYATVLPFGSGRPWVWSEEILGVLGRDSLNKVVPFVVVPPEGYGIMVVIQELRIPASNTFNRTLLVIDDNGRIMECFSKFIFQIEGKSPVQVCGKTNDDNEKIRPGVLDGIGPRSFVVPEGKSITVSFIYRDEQIDKSISLSGQVPFYDFAYLLRGSIAFTAYKNCPHGPPYQDQMNRKLWPCDIPQNNREPVSACVHEDVFCDDVINCGIHGYHDFGIDERFCKPTENPIETNYIGNHHRQRTTVLNSSLLEEAIHTRVIHHNHQQHGHNDGIMGAHSTRPRPVLGGDFNFTTESIDSDYTHPAFVTLVILISIICALIIALLFRFCCKRCVGRMNPYGNSSNPEALARFHENLRTRDGEISGRGNDYGISSDTLFKLPSDDLPPSYEDLFPQEIHNKGYESDNVSPSVPSTPVHSSISATSQHTPNSNSNIVIVPVQRIPATTNDYPMASSIYTIPIVQQQQFSLSHNRESDHRFLNLNPSLIQVEVLSGGREVQNESIISASNEVSSSLPNFNHNNRRLSSDNETHDGSLEQQVDNNSDSK